MAIAKARRRQLPFLLLAFNVNTAAPTRAIIDAGGASHDEADCADAYDACHRWAIDGACAALPRFMHISCALSCGMCETKSGQLPRDPCVPVDDALLPGALRNIFDAAAASAALQPHVVSADPPIIVLDLMNETDAAEMAATAEQLGSFGASGSGCAFQRGRCNSSASA